MDRTIIGRQREVLHWIGEGKTLRYNGTFIDCRSS
jgi:hypothetical protein